MTVFDIIVFVYLSFFLINLIIGILTDINEDLILVSFVPILNMVAIIVLIYDGITSLMKIIKNKYILRQIKNNHFYQITHTKYELNTIHHLLC